MTLRNLLARGSFGSQMVDLDVLQIVQSLKAQAWSDEVIESNGFVVFNLIQYLTLFSISV